MFLRYSAALRQDDGIGSLKIPVPTGGLTYSERGVELACRLGIEQKAEIWLAYILEVPRTLPLEAPLPQAELKAKDALKRAEDIVTLRGLNPIIKIDRARVAAEEIIDLVKINDIDLIVLGIKSKHRFAHSVLGVTTETILRRAPCEVIIDKIEEG